jgi:hypothetical protein
MRPVQIPNCPDTNPNGGASSQLIHNSDRKRIPYLSSNSCNANRSRNSIETLETPRSTDAPTVQIRNRSRPEPKRVKPRGSNLGDEDGWAEGLADAAVLVIHHEAKADNAGGAHLTVPARPVGHPLQRIRAHSAAVVHLGQAAEIGGGGEEFFFSTAAKSWGAGGRRDERRREGSGRRTGTVPFLTFLAFIVLHTLEWEEP